MHKSLVTGISDFPMDKVPTTPDPLPRVLPDGRLLIFLGFRDLQVPMPGVSDLRYARSRDTCPSSDGRLRLTLRISRLSMSQLSCPQELRFPDGQYPDSCRSPTSSVLLTRVPPNGRFRFRVGVSFRDFPDPSFTGIPICRFPIRWSSDGPLTCHLSSRVAHTLSGNRIS
jgi:hypothetical protein